MQIIDASDKGCNLGTYIQSLFEPVDEDSYLELQSYHEREWDSNVIDSYFISKIIALVSEEEVHQVNSIQSFRKEHAHRILGKTKYRNTIGYFLITGETLNHSVTNLFIAIPDEKDITLTQIMGI